MKAVDLLTLKGRSSLNLTDKFNTAQKDTYQSFRHTPEVTLIHRPFRTGKTTVLLTHTLEVISNPDTTNRILYLIKSNPAVNDIALQLHTRATKCSLAYKTIIQAYILKSKKTEVYYYFNNQNQSQERFQVTDKFIAHFSTLIYLNQLAITYCKT